MSDVVNKKTTEFTIDTLVEMLSRVGNPVKHVALTAFCTDNSMCYNVADEENLSP